LTWVNHPNTNVCGGPKQHLIARTIVDVCAADPTHRSGSGLPWRWGANRCRVQAARCMIQLNATEFQVTLEDGGPAVSSTNVLITSDGQPLAASPGLTAQIPVDRVDTIWLSASLLNDAGLGGLSVTTFGSISVEAPVTLEDDGIVSLSSPDVAVSSTLTVRGGQVSVGNYAHGAIAGSPVHSLRTAVTHSHDST
jgi:hypothetical protein